MNKIIIFDVDDVIWDLNRRVSKVTGIPYEKFTVFNVHKNPNFTTEQKETVIAAYQNADIFKNMNFREKVIRLINRVHNDYPDYTVQIVSNCLTKAIRDEKNEAVTYCIRSSRSKHSFERH